MRTLTPRSDPGQTLVETVLVLPLFITIVAGIIVFGIGLFYQQQVETAAREAARYAAIHSATADCPTRSWKDVNVAMLPEDVPLTTDPNCDPQPAWPKMTAHARQLAFGLDPGQVHLSACWSGYTDKFSGAHDAPSTTTDPSTGDTVANDWDECTIGGIRPLTDASSLPCPPPPTTETDDKASNLATSSGGTANRVSVYTCYTWSPPLAGFLLIPATVTFRATISEMLQHQR